MLVVLLQLFPLVLGSVATPTWILLVFLLLRSGRGSLEAVAFVVGVTTVRLLQGFVFGIILSAYNVPHQNHGTPDTIVSLLWLLAGLVLWLAALRQWRAKTDPENPLPRWLTFVNRLTPLKALGLGALLVFTSTRSWLFTLGALGTISFADIGLLRATILYALYVLGANALLITPIFLARNSSARFEVAAHWIERHNRTIIIVVSLAIGGFFLWRGATGLID